MPHVFHCDHFEDGIVRETCACGAVRFGISDYETFNSREVTGFLARATALNRAEGKNVDHPVTDVPRVVIDPSPNVIAVSQEVSELSGTYGQHDHYERNREAILEDVKSLSKAQFKTKWNIHEATLWPMMKRWVPDLEGIPAWARAPKDREPIADASPLPKQVKVQAQVKPKPRERQEPAVHRLLLEAEYEGYRRAVREMFALAVESVRLGH